VNDLVECVLAGIAPASVLDLFEAYKETDSYYNVKDHFPIKLVIKRWEELGQKIYDASMPTMYDPDELWRYREYDWTREGARSGYAIVDGESVWLDGPLKWDALVIDLKSRGWDKRNPLHLDIGLGRAMVGEGNHRLAIAKDAGIDVPVEFHFKSGQLGLPARSPKRKEREMRDREEIQARSLKQAVKKAEQKSLSPEQEKNIKDLMDLLGW
jgi:hypothetical protein